MKKKETIAVAFPSWIESLEFVFYFLLAITIPFFLEKPQILVGSMVNAVLVLAALKLTDWKKLFPLIIFPSMATVAHNLLFGSFTFYLVYMLPFIWLGNFILVLAIKKFSSFQLKVLSGGIVKVLLIFLSANVLISFSIIPKIFFQAMGIFQLITFLIGMTAALIINSLLKIF